MAKSRMNKKMQECFTPHAMMHSLFGLGLGILLAGLFGITNVWLGLILMIVAIVWDYMRK